ncbi:MAG TPA: hypothetical protein VNK95_03400 [Caldilineaceae bacterium]|nr:hypothetical protein [Caldilineaceae bacterium]
MIYSNHDPALSSEPTAIFPRRVVLPFLLVYLAVSLRMLWTDTLAALVQLRPVVQITDAEYDAHMQWTLQIPRRDTLLLFGIILVFNIVVYGVQGVSMPLAMAQTLPRDLPAAAFILGTLILLGWLLVYLVYVSVRYSLGLHRLAQQPLTINVLDPYALLPFGRLALLYSLTLVGLILILIVPLGLPTVFDEYLVVFLATLGSFLALIVPLWGVHRQIQAAKQEVLGKIHQQFREVQDILLDGSYFEKEELDDLSDRTEKLTKLRKLVWDAPNWPFKTWAGVFRAALAALIPVILIVLQEIVKFYIGFLLGSPSGP